MNCQEVEPLLTRYVDDEATAAERERVGAHLAECRQCATAAAKEHAARRLVQVRGRVLASPAPPGLRERCAALARPRYVASGFSRTSSWRDVASGSRRTSWWRNLTPGSSLMSWWRSAGLASAVAGLALVAAIGYGALTHSPGFLVAGLTLDHLKCFALHGGQAAVADPRSVEAYLEQNYGWHVKVPAGAATQALTLLGARRCLSMDGTTAHVMYSHGGNPLSLYVLPEGAVHETETRTFAGHPAAIWSRGDRTYVLVGSESDAGIRRVAAYFRSAVN